MKCFMLVEASSCCFALFSRGWQRKRTKHFYKIEKSFNKRLRAANKSIEGNYFPSHLFPSLFSIFKQMIGGKATISEHGRGGWVGFRLPNLKNRYCSSFQPSTVKRQAGLVEMLKRKTFFHLQCEWMRGNWEWIINELDAFDDPRQLPLDAFVRCYFPGHKGASYEHVKFGGSALTLIADEGERHKNRDCIIGERSYNRKFR